MLGFKNLVLSIVNNVFGLRDAAGGENNGRGKN
jgi:hypothetical protein